MKTDWGFLRTVLRKIFGPKMEKDGSGRKLHNDELHSLYSSPDIVRVIKSKRIRWVGHVAHMGEGRGVYMVLVERPEVKIVLGMHWQRWEANVKMDLRKIGNDGVTGCNWLRIESGGGFSVQFYSIRFFIISVLYQQPDG
ncbi:hypothetical protein L798_00375 [Zootermopsis nevadensis]|uniref:Uncharacterized protein n=1 Tax=Zootermopsis nevadensis TaxID=136037 RepID=A0A067RDB8_ZOONE|nr:hypothetical protein L798_00375 [Zootermopsis nevadensis]